MTALKRDTSLGFAAKVAGAGLLGVLVGGAVIGYADLNPQTTRSSRASSGGMVPECASQVQLVTDLVSEVNAMPRPIPAQVWEDNEFLRQSYVSQVRTCVQATCEPRLERINDLQLEIVTLATHIENAQGAIVHVEFLIDQQQERVDWLADATEAAILAFEEYRSALPDPASPEQEAELRRLSDRYEELQDQLDAAVDEMEELQQRLDDWRADLQEYQDAHEAAQQEQSQLLGEYAICESSYDWDAPEFDPNTGGTGYSSWSKRAPRDGGSVSVPQTLGVPSKSAY